jgi:hypothetical protein
VQSTYPEWLASHYPAQGKLCQDCHMRPDGETNSFCLWEPVERNPAGIHTHGFAGRTPEHLAGALTLSLQIERRQEAGEVRVDVRLTNSGAGHSVPTGITMRQVLLEVEARRASGSRLELLEGPRLPGWAGEGGPPSQGYLAGLPGRAYARITTDGKSERVFDSEATGIAADTRIPPLATDATSYRFALAGYRGTVEVRARTIHRRWWRDLEEERGLPRGDALMVERAETLPGGPAEFLRGDTDGSGGLDLTDAVVVLGYLFTGEPADLLCPDAADANDSGALDLSDAIAILGYLFTGAEAPPEPFPGPGPDSTPDPLDC